VAGFLRDRAIAHYFGIGPHADVLRTALRGPNILQNLLGEGTISAAFIPIYSRMIEEGRERDAGRFAGAVFGLLLALAAGLSLLGILFATPIVTALTPGFLGDAARVAAGEIAIDRFALTVTAVRIIFPMTGVLVLSAWALGVLNSHRRFFLPYFAPVLWNTAIIAGVILAARETFGAGDGSLRDRILIAACLGALAGGILQFGVQLPLVASVMRGFQFSFSTRVEGVRNALRAFGPVALGRGVVQISAYFDLVLASLLATGAIAALGWAQTLYVLPVSLFGLSVAAAELPELSRRQGETARAEFTERLSTSLRQMAFLTVPTFTGYVLFGYLLVGALYRTGQFGVADNWLVYLVLCGYSAGLLATTWSRLLQNTYFALGNTKTPALIAAVRVLVSATTAVPLMLALDRFPVSAVAGETAALGSGLFLGACGLAIASALGAGIELLLLDNRLRARVEGFSLPRAVAVRMLGVSILAALPAGLTWKLLPAMHIALTAAIVVGLYALVYLVTARMFGLSEMRTWFGRPGGGTAGD